MVVKANLHLLSRVAFPRTPMSRQWTHTPLRALHSPTPPPSRLVLEPPLHLLPQIAHTPKPELAIPGYTCTTHIFPAAWPRSTPFVALPSELREKEGESKDERKARLERLADAMLAIKAAQEREGADTSMQPASDTGRVLWMSATRWVRDRTSGEGNKTLLCTHANGLHSATYAPLLRHLLSYQQDISEIWSLDSIQHGDASLLNASNLGILYSWHEMARDSLCFLLHYMPSTPSPTPLPTVLPRVSPGGTRRKVHALGHSFGGCALVLAALHNPTVFASLMLADAVIVPPDLDRTTARAPGWIAPDGTTTSTGHNSLRAFVLGALSRRSGWASRDAAYEALAANPFFGSWDKEVLDVYVKNALVEDEEGGAVRLKCDGVSEAVVFAESRAPREAWSGVHRLDVRVPLFWINPPAGESLVQTQEIADARVRLRAANSAHTTIPHGTHLIVQTHPRQVADAVHAFLNVVDTGDVGNAREMSEGGQSGSRARL